MPIDDVTGRRPSTTSTRPWRTAPERRARKRLQTCGAASVRFSKPSSDDDDAEPETPPTTPANPFGVTTGAARPGVITSGARGASGRAPRASDDRRTPLTQPVARAAPDHPASRDIQ